MQCDPNLQIIERVTFSWRWGKGRFPPSSRLYFIAWIALLRFKPNDFEMRASQVERNISRLEAAEIEKFISAVS